jgi:G3E family GTPase
MVCLVSDLASQCLLSTALVGGHLAAARGALDKHRFNMFMRDLLGEKARDIFRSKGVLSIKVGAARFSRCACPAAQRASRRCFCTGLAAASCRPSTSPRFTFAAAAAAHSRHLMATPKTRGISVYSQGQERTKFMFQGVHETICFGPAATGWAEDEEPINQIVFIGRSLSRKVRRRRAGGPALRGWAAQRGQAAWCQS